MVIGCGLCVMAICHICYLFPFAPKIQKNHVRNLHMGDSELFFNIPLCLLNYTPGLQICGCMSKGTELYFSVL